MAAQKFKIALLQLLVGTDKNVNLQKAVAKIKEAASNGAKIVVLPETFNSPYGNQYFRQYSEPIPGPSSDALSQVSKECKIDLIGGSLIENEGETLFNTSLAFNPEGKLMAKHRKVHLFDIDVPGKITFKESETLSAGNKLTVFDAEVCKVGMGICYDIRFAEMARIYADKGCQLLVYPGAFNMTTGPAHWELLTRSTAVNNQVFTVVCSPARDTNASYIAWGHSMVVDPWGTILAKAEEEEAIIYADIDLNKIEEVRGMIPITKQRRNDLYDTVSKETSV